MELRPTTTKSCGFNLIKIPIENQQSVSSAVDVEQDRILDIIRLVIQGIPRYILLIYYIISLTSSFSFI